jgi:hypothetical protein
MTTGMMGDDEGLLTGQDAAGLLEVALLTLRRWHREVPGRLVWRSAGRCGTGEPVSSDG